MADAEVVYAAFAARYHGALEPGDAIRWAEDPLATARDGSASPGHLLEERRRALYRAAVDPAVVDAFETAVADWDRELAIARAAMSPEPTAPAASILRAVSSRMLGALALAVGVVAAAATGVALGAHAVAVQAPAVVAPPTIAASIAAGVPGMLLARASAEHGARSASGLDGTGRFVTIVVTCQGDGHVEVRLSDGTLARFACISGFPRTAVQPSDGPVGRFSYAVTVAGTPDWAMTLSR